MQRHTAPKHNYPTRSASNRATTTDENATTRTRTTAYAPIDRTSIPRAHVSSDVTLPAGTYLVVKPGGGLEIVSLPLAVGTQVVVTGDKRLKPVVPSPGQRTDPRTDPVQPLSLATEQTRRNERTTPTPPPPGSPTQYIQEKPVVVSPGKNTSANEDRTNNTNNKDKAIDDLITEEKREDDDRNSNHSHGSRNPDTKTKDTNDNQQPHSSTKSITETKENRHKAESERDNTEQETRAKLEELMVQETPVTKQDIYELFGKASKDQSIIDREKKSAIVKASQTTIPLTTMAANIIEIMEQD